MIFILTHSKTTLKLSGFDKFYYLQNMKFLTLLFVIVILIVGAGDSHAGDIAKHVDDIDISDVVVYDVENENVCQDAGGIIIGVILKDQYFYSHSLANSLDDIIQISKLQEDSIYKVYNYDYDINPYPDIMVLHNQFAKNYRPTPIPTRRMHRTQHRL